MSIIKLSPAGKSYIWGGTKLREKYGKDIPITPLAETWECSVHPDGESIVISGEYTGMTLREVIESNPSFSGENCAVEFPVLIKLIDAAEDLSVQVHPDDVYACLHGGQGGKNELWYVLEAEEDSSVIYGFENTITREEAEKAIHSGKLMEYLHREPVKSGDILYIPAGTVHAIGAGIVIAEIQQNSNVTYRVFDYGRTDSDGNERPLHIEQALDVMKLRPAKKQSAMNVSVSGENYDTEYLCRCKNFLIRKAVIRTEMPIEAGKDSFMAILCTDGHAVISGGSESVSIKKGECVFIPADSGKYTFSGKSEMLITSV